MEQLAFLSEDQVRAVRAEFGTPVYVYDAATLEARCRAVLDFPNAYGMTVRYAMKALPTGAILRLVTRMGLHVDASSGFEAARALHAGIAPERIQITAQELPRDLEALVSQGILFNACSLSQIRAYGALFPGSEISVRINPGLGSGGTDRTNTGGPAASFGIWHGHLDAIYSAAEEYDLRVTGMHTHIGSGSDPEVWVHCARLSLDIAARMPGVTRLSLGGGYKVARMADETESNLQDIGSRMLPEFEAFARDHGRELHLEIEPGAYLAANAGALVCSVMDVVDTGGGGYRFIKVDSGMTENLRTSMYGAQHPIIVVPEQAEARAAAEYLVVGHCCESGDILTPAPGDPEALAPRELCEAWPGDLLVVEAAGAYCGAMSAKNYNSFPEAPEVMLTTVGEFQLIRQRQRLEQIVQNELGG